MHELSIATSLVEQAAEHCRAAGVCQATAVTLRVGRLASVHADALRFCYDLLRQGTPLEHAELRIVDVPLRIWCPRCVAEVELPGIQGLTCPTCGTTSGDIRAGRELDLDSIELRSPDEPPA